MYCPKCHKTYSAGNKWCMECEDENGMPIRLIEEPTNSGGFNLNLGDANAISGGINLSDSHNVHNEDYSVHNTSNVSNVTTNVTNVAAQKSDVERHQEAMNQYREEFKKAYDDEYITPMERAKLFDLRSRLHLSVNECNKIEDDVRAEFKQAAKTDKLSFFDKMDLDDFIEAIENNDVTSIKDKLDTIESIANNSVNDDVQYAYYMALSVLDSDKCIEKFEAGRTSNYWRYYWSYIAYLKANRQREARNILGALSKFRNYPQDNAVLLAAAGALIQEGPDEVRRYLVNYHGNITSSLNRFTQSLMLLTDSKKAERMGADENKCAFYLDNFFTQKDPLTEIGKSHISSNLKSEHISGAPFSFNDGVLFIANTFKMVDYKASWDTPWKDYIDRIEKIKVQDGVTSIGAFAFSDCCNLISVELPDSLRKIGEGAFQYCKSLESIKIPYGVEAIEDTAFYGCESIYRIVIPGSVKRIGVSSFNCCINLESAFIGIGVESIDSYAFEDCRKLRSIVLPSTIIKEGTDVFPRTCKVDRDFG